MTYPVLLCVPSSVPCLILLCVPSSSAFLNPPVHPFLYTIFCYSLGVPHLSCLHYRSRSVYMYKHKHACTGADVFRFSGEYMYMYQACRVVRYGTITVCTVRTVFVKLRRTTVIVTPYSTVISVKYGTVYSTIVRLTGYGKKNAWRGSEHISLQVLQKFQFFQSSSCISITPFSPSVAAK